MNVHPILVIGISTAVPNYCLIPTQGLGIKLMPLNPLKITLLICCLYAHTGIFLSAQEVDSTPVKGTWFSPSELEMADFVWNAQWIWLADSISSDVMLTRRSFEVPEVPESAELQITATSQYQLYINGKYFCRGPARCAPHHQSFDVLKIKDHIKEGKNIIAVRVHYQKGKRSYHHHGRAGLLIQLIMVSDGKKSLVLTNNKWKVCPDPSWDNSAATINRFQLVVNDKMDLRDKIKEWTSDSFDDSGWTNAKPLMREVGWPSPPNNALARPLTPPWTSLVPRDIPYLNEIEIKAGQLIETTQISEFPITLSRGIDAGIAKDLSEFANGERPLIIPPTNTSQDQFLLFDFGRVRNGMPQLDITGPPGTIVEVCSAPFMINDAFTPEVVDSEFRDHLILSGERDRWEATYFKPARYLGLVIKNEKDPVKLHAVGMRQLTYPFERRGHIYTPDAPWVQNYMDASAKTIEVCTTDGYTDNYRERRQYAQTGYYAALGNYWLFGDYALQRRYLVQVAQEQEANGMMPAYAPLASDDYMIILDANCLWIRSLRNYFLFSGDTLTVRQLLPAAQKLMALLHSYTHPLGFIYNPPFPYWLDHAQNDRRGANFCLNGHYLGALEDFAEILRWLGQPGVSILQRRADLLRQSLQNYLWDDNKGLFVDAWIDGERSNQYSEHANAMALAMEVAKADQAEKITAQLLTNDDHDYIKRLTGMTIVTPAMSYFLHKGLCEQGNIEASLRLFRQRFDKMLQPPANGTLWEEWWLDGTGRSGSFQGGRTRSDAQTESAFPPALFGEFLLGVRPLQPGWKEVSISNEESGVADLDGMVPTPEGMLIVNWNRGNEIGNNRLVITIPGSMQVRLDLGSLNIPEYNSIIVDGKKTAINLQKQQHIILTGGNHWVKF